MIYGKAVAHIFSKRGKNHTQNKNRFITQAFKNNKMSGVGKYVRSLSSLMVSPCMSGVISLVAKRLMVCLGCLTKGFSRKAVKNAKLEGS